MSGLESDPFAWRVTKDGTVRVSRGGREVAVVAGKAAHKVRAAIDRGDPEEIQHALARATGQYRYGNERMPGRP